MNIRTIDRLRRASRRFSNLSVPWGIILAYHRVGEVGSDPWSLCVTPEHFAEHLEVMREFGCALGLPRLAKALRERKPLRRAIVVTFDDGYADNLYNAKPLLERYDIPATIFITTGCIGQEGEFWWDELDKLLLQPGTLPQTFHLSRDGDSCQWELGDAADYSEDEHRRYLKWTTYLVEKNDPTPRHRLYRSLYRLLRPLPEFERRKLLDELHTWAAADPKARPTHRVLSPDELLLLGEGRLMEVGAHTATHPALSALPIAMQRDEIYRSRVRLEEILGFPVTSFAYPYGSAYSKETLTLVREAGFTCACSTLLDAVWRRTDPFQLPRVIVEDCDGETLARFIRWLALG
jgi:peptidoglycan/xylan/chitin deacetylase (PgdA/CDA1 family)